jgi:hypothetical protein
MNINQAKDNVVNLAKDTADKVVDCAKDCASKVQSKAQETASVVSKTGKGWAYKALTGICENKWLARAEGVIVGALNRVNEAPKVEAAEPEAKKAVEVV